MNDFAKGPTGISKDIRTASTYEISCLTNMANVVKEMAEKGISIPAGQVFSYRGQVHRPGTKDTGRVKDHERSAQLVKLGYGLFRTSQLVVSGWQLSLRPSSRPLLDVGTDGFLLLAGEPAPVRWRLPHGHGHGGHGRVR